MCSLMKRGATTAGERRERAAAAEMSSGTAKAVMGYCLTLSVEW